MSSSEAVYVNRSFDTRRQHERAHLELPKDDSSDGIWRWSRLDKGMLVTFKLSARLEVRICWWNGQIGARWRHWHGSVEGSISVSGGVLGVQGAIRALCCQVVTDPEFHDTAAFTI